MDTLDKKYYNIGEVSKLTGLPQSTLRYWEKEFPTVVKPHRNSGKTRFYTPDDVRGVRMLQYLLKERGLKMDAARAELTRNPEGITRRFEAVARLQDMRGRLLELREALASRD
ncbi:MAG: MerR family transcriptional regulator [Muribaculaceae bacterium]|nr:MerR family transcriptional regulator [Muribaculaceae bacterium]